MVIDRRGIFFYGCTKIIKLNKFNILYAFKVGSDSTIISDSVIVYVNEIYIFESEEE